MEAKFNYGDKEILLGLYCFLIICFRCLMILVLFIGL